MKRWLLFLICCVFLASCATGKSQRVMKRSTGDLEGVFQKINPNKTRFVRDYIFGLDEPEVDHKIYAYLLLPWVTPKNESQVKASVLGFMCGVPMPYNVMFGSSERSSYGVLYALLRKEYEVDRAGIDGNFDGRVKIFLNKYNFFGSKILVEKINKSLAQNSNISENGLYIVGAERPIIDNIDKLSDLNINISPDLSKKEPDEALSYVAGFSDRLTLDPSNWSNEPDKNNDSVTIFFESVGRYVKTIKSVIFGREAEARKNENSKMPESCSDLRIYMD